MATTYVYRLDVTKPAGSDAPGWEPKGWEALQAELWQFGPREFRWPRRTLYFNGTHAMERARLLERFGAVVIVQTRRIDWPEVEH